jgi:antirestriction protein ArdC
MVLRKDIYQEVTEKIIKELEAGAVPWLKPWTTNTSQDRVGVPGRPRNAVTGRKYSGINVLLLWSAQDDRLFQSDQWLTFKQAKELGGHVRAGEKSTQIVFMKPHAKTVTNAETGEEEEHTYLVAKTFNVFNTEQCEGLPRNLTPAQQPRLVVTDSPKAELCPVKQAWVNATGVRLKHGGDRACYIPSVDEIHMPVAEDFDTRDHYWATLFHEQIHWTKAGNRLDRDFGRKRWGDEGYAMEELVAEMGAAYLCADHGVKGDMRHAGYIESWLKVLKGDKRAIFTAASKASQAAEFLHAFSEQPKEERLAA